MIYWASDMLVDKHNANVLSLIGESIEGSLNGSGVCLVVDNEKVLLRIGARGDMLVSCVSKKKKSQCDAKLTPMPARSSPVTES